MRAGAKASGLFKSIELDRGRAMQTDIPQIEGPLARLRKGNSPVGRL